MIDISFKNSVKKLDRFRKRTLMYLIRSRDRDRYRDRDI
jgi:hypothetical protein